MSKVKIFIADDHVILRDGLKHILLEEKNNEIIGEADDGIEALEKIEQLEPDIAIIDIAMPRMNGLSVSEKILKYNKKSRIIILTRHDNEEYVQQAMNIGARGFILKDSAGDDLLKAVKDVMKGEIYLSPRIVTRIVGAGKYNQYNNAKSFEILTRREKEVLKLVSEGLKSNEIASLLRLSPKTVKVHRLNIMNKLGIHTIPELVRYAIKTGVIEL